MLEAQKGPMGHAGRPDEVAVVEEGEDVEIREFVLKAAEDRVEGCGKEPGAVRVALTDALAGADKAYWWAVVAAVVSVGRRGGWAAVAVCSTWGRDGFAACEEERLVGVLLLDG